MKHHYYSGGNSGSCGDPRDNSQNIKVADKQVHVTADGIEHDSPECRFSDLVSAASGC